ncbi:hypothetical protein CLV30_109192 [Haloactinopolyspora alba]|uniref:Uncharacterized protein n=1 Tax=Haloactinopolyspora alba TaxID=648780 RepID=A0A2P8E099_9ACTN|nr:hypothetical protein [Haloactinopolyspora alba]PSL02884.1 hypothetical protein CLV30_109192 [Haloactinopolyspora alba]
MDKELLFKARLPEGEVEVPGLGTVRVRGLSRDEVLAAQKADNTADLERRMLAAGMVDPALTVAEAGRWQMASPAGELEPVTQKIRDLSGMGDDASKSGGEGAGDGAGSGVRDVPGAEAVDDGGPPPPRDEQ